MLSSARLRHGHKEVRLRESLGLRGAGGRRTTWDPPPQDMLWAQRQARSAPHADTCPRARRRRRSSEATHALQGSPWHLRSKGLSSPVAGKGFLLEGKLLPPSLALPTPPLAVTHSYSKRQQDQAAGAPGLDRPAARSRGRAGTHMHARVRVHRQESSRNKVRGNTPPRAQAGHGPGSPAASVLFVLPIPASAPWLPCS